MTNNKESTVQSISEYENTIARLQAECADSLLLFRGQVADRTFRTSLHREESARDPTIIPDIHYSWSEFASSALAKVGKESHRRSESTMAILQHYGARSSFLDVTHDPLIALWFSLHQFVKERSLLIDETDLPHLFFHPFIVADYVCSSAPNGFVYVLSVPPSLQESHLFDLERSMPSGVLRVHRQRGALLANREGAFDWNAHVIAKLRIDGPLTQHVFPETICFSSLFPSPDEDALYRELIRVPFFVPFARTGNPIEVNPLLMLPYYVGHFGENPSAEKIALNMRGILKYLLVTPAQYFFPYIRGRLDGIHEHGPTSHRIVDAKPVVVPRVNVWEPIHGHVFGEGIMDPGDQSGPPPDELLELWTPSKGNIFLEFTLGAYLVWPSDDKCTLIRALWIIIESDLVYLEPIWEDVERREGSMAQGPGMHFRYRDGVYDVEPQHGDSPKPDMLVHLWWLTIFFRATRWLHQEGWALTWDSTAKLFHLERPHEDSLTTLQT
jgi:hypothetical protein